MRRNVVINLFIFICAIFASLLFFSKNTFADRFDTSETQTVRSLGMGNAGINSERGGLSVFYNPANIAAKSTRPVLQLFNFSLETFKL